MDGINKGMNNKRSVVYISADPEDTYTALYTLNRVILQLGGLPVQSYFVAASGEYDWPLIRSAIDESDIFVLIVGNSYGAISESGESYIHREAAYAKSKHKTVVALLKNAELKGLSNQSIERLRSLHRQMMSGTFKYWGSKEDLVLIARQVLREHLTPQLSVHAGQKEFSTENIMQNAIIDTLFDMECYPMRFTGKVFAHGNCHEVTQRVEVPWDAAFLNVGAIMTSPVTEGRMRAVIEDYVEDNYREEFTKSILDAHALAGVRCNELEFQRFKAYLKGAGVIENVSIGAGGLRSYWQLTARGEHKLHQLLVPSIG